MDSGWFKEARKTRIYIFREAKVSAISQATVILPPITRKEMQNKYTTARLVLDNVAPGDAEFILRLVNTAGWLMFIGDRNIRTPEDALAYVQKILDSPHQHYWVVRLREENIPAGIITLLKRDYLEHHDIGFAFLPEYGGKGYAYEAAVAVLDDTINDPAHNAILAITMADNSSSIKLLKQLGLRFEREMTVGEEVLLVHGVQR